MYEELVAMGALISLNYMLYQYIKDETEIGFKLGGMLGWFGLLCVQLWFGWAFLNNMASNLTAPFLILFYGFSSVGFLFFLLKIVLSIKDKLAQAAKEKGIG